MRFFTFVWKNISRRPTRSILTVVGLAVSVATVVALVGISEGFKRHFMNLYSARGIDLVVQKVGSSTELNNGLPEELADRIRKLPHVSKVIEGLMDLVSFEDQNLVGVLMDGRPAGATLFNDQKLLTGRELRPGDRHKVLLGEVLAENLGKKVGDTLQIDAYGEDFEVVGIFHDNNVYAASEIVALLPDMQEAMNRPHQVTGFAIQTDLSKENTVQNQNEMASLQRQIESLGKGLAAERSDTFIENVGPIRLSQAMAWIVSAIALVIGFIGMLNTMVMSVYERIREIGTFRAMGWRKRRVVRMILVEALLLSFAGAVIGTIAAVLLTHALSNLPVAKGVIAGDIAPMVVVEGFLLALLVGVVGSIYPAYWGANLSPVEALRKR